MACYNFKMGHYHIITESKFIDQTGKSCQVRKLMLTIENGCVEWVEWHLTMPTVDCHKAAKLLVLFGLTI